MLKPVGPSHLVQELLAAFGVSTGALDCDGERSFCGVARDEIAGAAEAGNVGRAFVAAITAIPTLKPQCKPISICRCSSPFTSV